MLPIALTCPVWWVARWTARMVASLAMAVACSLGAATLPVGPAPAAHAAAHPAAVDTAALIRWSGRAADAVPGAAASCSSIRGGARSAEVAGGAASASRVTGDRPAVPVGAPLTRSVVVAPADRHRVLVGLVPAAAGSRAPPAR